MGFSAWLHRRCATNLAAGKLFPICCLHWPKHHGLRASKLQSIFGCHLLAVGLKVGVVSSVVVLVLLVSLLLVLPPLLHPGILEVIVLSLPVVTMHTKTSYGDHCLSPVVASFCLSLVSFFSALAMQQVLRILEPPDVSSGCLSCGGGG